MIQKFEQSGFTIVMRRKDSDGMANNVDSDQTAPEGAGLTLFTHETCLSEYLRSWW